MGGLSEGFLVRWYSSQDLFQKDWFSDLSSKQKVFWHYLNTHCNVAGIWEPNFKTASAVCGEKFSATDLKAFGPRLKQLPSGKILILEYATDQWGDLSSNTGIQKKINDLLRREGLTINDLSIVPTTPISEVLSTPREGEGEGEGVREGDLEKESEEKPFQKIVDAWNSIQGLPSVRAITKDRKEAILVRLRDSQFAENWETALMEIPSRPFLMGQNDRGWKADFDWFLKPNSVLRIMEGNYKGASTNGTHKPAEQHQLQETIKIRTI